MRATIDQGKDTTLTPALTRGLRHAYSVGRFLGMARRAPVLANGQVPGIRRRYDTTYALVLSEQQGPYPRKDTGR